jgi:hypothetical protein
MTAPVDVLAGPYRVRQEFVRGRNLPFYIIIGRGNNTLSYSSGRRVTFKSEAAANERAAALARDGGGA